MPKIPECDRALAQFSQSLVVCAMHPTEPDSDRCLNFRPSWLVKLEFGAPNS
ncbi:MAG: hypothetical protein AB1861_22955 [Cyanobacteriota bacterium]